ncbi:MobA/MobL family protein [Luteibacter sp. PPL554]
MTVQFSARPHLSVHTRTKDHSAVAGAAYRLGIKLYDERTLTWHDYTKRKRGEQIVRAMTIAPDGAPAWATDPAVLWNAVESAEKRRDSQVARDYRFPVPLGLSDEQAGDLAEAMARFIATELHTSVSMAVHRDAHVDAFGVTKANGKQGTHAHLYFPTRPIAKGAIDGAAPAFGAKLATFRNQEVGAACIERFNEKWADLANLIAGQAGLDATYDHRSYKRMGLARKAEPKLGQAATALERKGIVTRNGEALRQAREARGDTAVPVSRDPFAIDVPPTVHGAGPVPVSREPLPIDPTEEAPSVVRPPLPEAKVRAVVTPRQPSAHTGGRGLTQQERMESPVHWEPPPIVGLAARFEEAYVAKTTARQGTVSAKVLVIVRAIEYALNALVTVGKALLHLDREYKRYANTRHDMRWESEQKREALAELRRQTDPSVAPPAYRPRLSAAHRARLAKIPTLEEELRERQRLVVSLDQQLEDLAQRAAPWRHQAIVDRRRLKDRLGALQEEDPDALQQLIGVANAEEQPWLKLYTASNEPTLSLQKLVDAAEASGEEQRKVDRTTQKAFRPPR